MVMYLVLCPSFFFSRMRTPLQSTLFPYTTLFRSVNIGVVHIAQRLVVGVGMYCRHGALFDTELVVQYLGNGRQAVSGARGVGDNLVAGLQGFMVNAVYHGGIHVSTGSRSEEHTSELQSRGH